MNELVIDDDGHMVWKERARWIKYEEDVELGGAWGKPHVSTLSFHSLLELRRLLELGLPLFDITETTLPGIVHRICAALRERGTLNENEAVQMEGTLLSTLSYVQIFVGNGLKISRIERRFISKINSKQKLKLFVINLKDFKLARI